jgi:outer membrane protein TolC
MTIAPPARLARTCRPRSRRRAAGLALSLAGASAAVAGLVGGCAVDQKKEVDLYRQVLDAHLPAPDPYAAGDALSLRQAMLLANRNNENLAIRGEDYVQALIFKNRVVAAFLPTVSFQPAFTLEQRARENGSTGGGPAGTGIGTGSTGTGTGSTNTAAAGGGGFRESGKIAYRTEAPIVGSLNLFRGFGDVSNYASAEAAAASRREVLLDAQATVLVNVAQVYFQVLRSEASVEVLRNTLKVQEARLADVTQQFNNQLAIRLSVAQTRAQVDATRVTLVQAESDVRNGRHTLALLIGTDGVTGPLREDMAAPPPESRPTADGYERLAAESRQDLRAASAQLLAARGAVDVAISQYYPAVSLNVSGFLYREFYADATKWSTILSANLPIFSAGLIEADVRLAWSRLRQAALYESFVRRQVMHDVRVAYENLVTADRRIRELEDEVQAAEEAYQQARNAYANNLAINLDVLTAQDQLLNSELQLTGAQFDRTVYYLDLVRATGRMGDVTGAGLLSPAAATRPATRASVGPLPATGPAADPATVPTTAPAATKPEGPQ